MKNSNTVNLKSCLGETNYKALTEKTLVFWIGGRLWGWYLTVGGRTWRFD